MNVTFFGNKCCVYITQYDVCLYGKRDSQRENHRVTAQGSDSPNRSRDSGPQSSGVHSHPQDKHVIYFTKRLQDCKISFTVTGGKKFVFLCIEFLMKTCICICCKEV